MCSRATASESLVRRYGAPSATFGEASLADATYAGYSNPSTLPHGGQGPSATYGVASSSSSISGIANVNYDCAAQGDAGRAGHYGVASNGTVGGTNVNYDAAAKAKHGTARYSSAQTGQVLAEYGVAGAEGARVSVYEAAAGQGPPGPDYSTAGRGNHGANVNPAYASRSTSAHGVYDAAGLEDPSGVSPYGLAANTSVSPYGLATNGGGSGAYDQATSAGHGATRGAAHVNAACAAGTPRGTPKGAVEYDQATGVGVNSYGNAEYAVAGHTTLPEYALAGNTTLPQYALAGNTTLPEYALAGNTAQAHAYGTPTHL